MHRFFDNRRIVETLLLSVGVLIACVRPAHAHKLNVFASAEGRAISGYCYFSGGVRARKLKVEILGPGGRKLGETTTDDQGQFSFEARFRCDHTFVVETPDGHRATYTVGAEELPEDLPSLEGVSTDGGTAAGTERAPSVVASGPAQPEADMKAIIEAALARHMRPLREQLDRYEAKVRIHEVIGGIGYIFGIMGILFFLKGRAVSRAAKRQQSA